MRSEQRQGDSVLSGAMEIASSGSIAQVQTSDFGTSVVDLQFMLQGNQALDPHDLQEDESLSLTDGTADADTKAESPGNSGSEVSPARESAHSVSTGEGSAHSNADATLSKTDVSTKASQESELASAKPQHDGRSDAVGAAKGDDEADAHQLQSDASPEASQDSAPESAKAHENGKPAAVDSVKGDSDTDAQFLTSDGSSKVSQESELASAKPEDGKPNALGVAMADISTDSNLLKSDASYKADQKSEPASAKHEDDGQPDAVAAANGKGNTSSSSMEHSQSAMRAGYLGSSGADNRSMAEAAARAEALQCVDMARDSDFASCKEAKMSMNLVLLGLNHAYLMDHTLLKCKVEGAIWLALLDLLSVRKLLADKMRADLRNDIAPHEHRAAFSAYICAYDAHLKYDVKSDEFLSNVVQKIKEVPGIEGALTRLDPVQMSEVSVLPQTSG